MQIEFTTNIRGRYGFLSNFAYSPLELPYDQDGRIVLIRPMSVEAEFQAIKYEPDDTDSDRIYDLKIHLQHAIRSAGSATEASMMGRDDVRAHDSNMSTRVRRVLEPSRAAMIRVRSDWDEVQDDLMMFLLRKKFEYPQFRGPLLETGDDYLIFHCARDLYWGTDHGEGENRLGKMLMSIREEIREELSLDGSAT